MTLGYEAENAGYQEPYPEGQYSPLPPAPANITAPGYPAENYYPSTNQFPPPPNAAYAANQNYNPADYPPPPGTQIHPDYGYPTQPGYTPPQGVYSPLPPDQYSGGPGRGRRGDENVSAEPYLNTTYAGPSPDHHDVEEGG